MNQYASFLFARPSFLEGVARIFDFGNTLNTYNTSPSPAEADNRAMAADWQAVSRDIRRAAAGFRRKARRKKDKQQCTQREQRGVKTVPSTAVNYQSD